MKVLIADDHEVIRRGLRQILREAYPFSLIGEAENGEELVQKAVSEPWDVIISDIAMPVMNGFEALKAIRQQRPHIPVLILSIPSEDQYTTRALKAGAAGYLSKDAATEELVKAVEQVLSGRNYVPEYHPEDDPWLPYKNLSSREMEVFTAIASGMSLTDIAQRLSLDVSTIGTYRSRILEKMDMKTNAEIITYAVRNHLI
jgi:two-component system, NarL family, invasion response regulator UvrY